jgi:hypothetical protein
MIRSILGVLAGAAIVVAGCAGHDDQDVTATSTAPLSTSSAAAGETARESGDLPASVEVFVVLDSPEACIESCAAGYWLRELDRVAPARWVPRLDLTALSHEARDQAFLAAPGEVIFHGSFGPSEGRVPAGSFVVTDAWRGMPFVHPPPTDPYVIVDDSGRRMVARELNGGREWLVRAVEIPALGTPWLDTAWLQDRVMNHAAIVAGRFDEARLEAAQVFVRLPDVAGTCPPLLIRCGSEIETYAFEPDRCLMPTGCAAHHICPEFVAVCGPGYSLKSWRAQPDGCPAFTCLPEFVSR